MAHLLPLTVQLSLRSGSGGKHVLSSSSSLRYGGIEVKDRIVVLQGIR